MSDATAFPVSSLSLLGISCCDANEDRVEGDGTELAAPSSDCGRVRRGSAKLLANAAKDGNEDGDVIAAADGVTAASEVVRPGVVGDVVYCSFNGSCGGEGVRGGGGWLSDVSQASRAAFSSKLAKGSNSVKTSFAASILGSAVFVSASPLSPAKIGCSYIDGSRVARGLGTSSSVVESLVEASAGVSSHGLGDTGMFGVANETIGAAGNGDEVASSNVGGMVSKGVGLEEDAM